MLQAGFAKIEYTPKEGHMPGQFEEEYATDKLTPLLANASAFTNGSDSLIMIAMDNVDIYVDFCGAIRERVSAATGVPISNIMVAATHTHTGAMLDRDCWHNPAEPETARNTANAAVEAAICAWESREAARLGVGITYEPRFSFIRDIYVRDGDIRTNPHGADLVRVTSAIDHSVNVMRVEDTAGKVKAFIVNYANHPDNHHDGKRNRFSADFPGYMREKLCEAYGEEVVVLFFNGTAGDVNCVDFIHKNDAHRRSGNCAKAIGEGLADTVLALQDRVFVDIDDPIIDVIDKKHKLPRRFKTKEMYEWALSLKDKIGKGEMSVADELYAMEYLGSDEGIAPEFDFEIQTIQIGPWAIVGLPSEIYTQIGLRIKADSPFPNTVVFELANGVHGYVVTDKTIGTSSYPARLHQRNSYAGKGSADIIVNGAAEQLEELFERAARREFCG